MNEINEKVSLASPWVLFYHEIEAMFSEDGDITVEYDENAIEVKLYVNGQEKADALGQLLPKSKFFGNVELKVTVVPANAEQSKVELIRKAFNGNPSVAKIQTVEGIMSNPITYVIFQKEVVQYWTDDLGDANGVRSTLWQDIAKELFDCGEGIFFCTDVN